jgi:phosphatidylglycerophosphate synthase
MASAWKKSGQNLVYGIVDPLIKLFIKLGVTPNMVTLMGLILNIGVTVILIFGAEYGIRNDHKHVFWAGLLILIAGLMDMLDGRLARVGNMANDYGALFDSVLDRYSELVMFLGICYYLITHDYFLSSLFAFIAMIGSIMVSYTRARAEGLGVTASVGMMQRPERILIVGISALLCGIASYYLGGEFKISWNGIIIIETITFFTFPLFLLAIGANVTAIKRLLYAKNEMNKQ